MQKVLPVVLILTAAVCPAAARQKKSLPITCETVRAYVAQVGLTQARALAIAYGMTPEQELRARRCL